MPVTAADVKLRFMSTVDVTVVNRSIAAATALVNGIAPETKTVNLARGINEMSPPVSSEWELPDGVERLLDGRQLKATTMQTVTYDTGISEDLKVTAILHLVQQDLVYQGYLSTSLGGVSGSVDIDRARVAWDLKVAVS